MAWNRDELREALRRYLAWLEARDLAKNTIRSHSYYGKLFSRWLYGEYAPRRCRRRRDPIAASRRLNCDELRAELGRYEAYLAECLAPGAVRTYVIGAGLFIKWLCEEDGGRGPALASSDEGGTRGGPKDHETAAAEPSDGWPSEVAVQSAVVAWLASQGWTIVRVADTASREHGVDIVARRGATDLLGEAKGYPSEMYSAGDRAGQPRKWHPASQARTYFGDALLAVLTMRDDSPASDVVLALPDVPGYRGLIDKVKGSLAALQIRVLFVGRDGSVSEEPGTS